MNPARIVTRFTEAQYLALERVSADKHEFADGYLWAMAGASQRHVDVCANVEAAFVRRRGMSPCRTTGSDQRVYVEASALYTYPDVTVACEPREYRRLREGMALTNPRVLVEVLSRGTRDYDTSEKLAYYQSIASVTDVVFVDPAALEVVRWTRRGERWDAATFREGEIGFEGLGISIDTAELFVDLAPADENLD